MVYYFLFWWLKVPESRKVKITLEIATRGLMITSSHVENSWIECALLHVWCMCLCVCVWKCEEVFNFLLIGVTWDVLYTEKQSWQVWWVQGTEIVVYEVLLEHQFVAAKKLQDLWLQICEYLQIFWSLRSGASLFCLLQFCLNKQMNWVIPRGYFSYCGWMCTGDLVFTNM